MGELGINTNYLKTNRGIIKIVQIALGVVVCALLCSSWYGKSCFGEGRIGTVSGISFVFLILNVVFFVINFINIDVHKLERIFVIVAIILFIIIAVLIIWFIIASSSDSNRLTLIIAAVCVVVILLLYSWDLKILQGESSNY